MDGWCVRLERLARLRFVVAAAIALTVAQLTTPCVARADDARLSGVNRRLAVIAREVAQPPRVVVPVASVAPATYVFPTTARTWPWRVPLALIRLSRYERALHLRTNTVNASLWGAFDHFRGTYVKVTIHFF